MRGVAPDNKHLYNNHCFRDMSRNNRPPRLLQDQIQTEARLSNLDKSWGHWRASAGRQVTKITQVCQKSSSSQPKYPQPQAWMKWHKEVFKDTIHCSYQGHDKRYSKCCVQKAVEQAKASLWHTIHYSSPCYGKAWRKEMQKLIQEDKGSLLLQNGGYV